MATAPMSRSTSAPRLVMIRETIPDTRSRKWDDMSGSTAGPGANANDRGRVTGDDRRTERLIGFLRSEGAGRLAHGDDRTLLEHLVGTYEIVCRWNQPPRLRYAALIHSVYGTDVFHQQLLLLSRRHDVIKIAGDQAERLAYLFCVTPRDLLFAGTHVWARDLPPPSGGGERGTNDQPPTTRAELDGLVLLHMANLAEQARADDGSPGRWLVRLRELAELLIGSEAVTLPLFVAELAAFSEADESLTRRAYRTGIARAGDPEAMANGLALSAAACPVVPEPCIWQAHLARSQGDLTAARSWARCARRRLLDLGTAWDKRLTFDEWLELAQLPEQATDRELPAAPAAITDPRTLFEAVLHRHLDPVSEPSLPLFSEQPFMPPDAAAGTKRFHRYIDRFAQADGAAVRGVYPDLDSQPWYDASDFSLARYLESHYEAIRDEILGLESSRFHRESERIKRSGAWDVAFLYERGRPARRGVRRVSDNDAWYRVLPGDAHRRRADLRVSDASRDTHPSSPWPDEPQGAVSSRDHGARRGLRDPRRRSSPALASRPLPCVLRLFRARGLESHRQGPDCLDRRHVASGTVGHRAALTRRSTQIRLCACPTAQPVLVLERCGGGTPAGGRHESPGALVPRQERLAVGALAEVAPVAPVSTVAAVSSVPVSTVAPVPVAFVATEQVADGLGAEPEPGTERRAHQQP